MPSPAEIAAYVGAAAWLPQIVALVYRATVRPKVTIVPEKQAEMYEWGDALARKINAYRNTLK